MNPTIGAIALMVVAFALLFAEIFLPSGGLIAVFMFCSFLGSIYFGYIAWWETSPVVFWAFYGCSIGLIPFMIFFAFYYLERSAWGKNFLLEQPTEDEVTPFQKEEERLNGYVGRSAKTLTLLNPSGLVVLDGERIHCVSEGNMLDPGTLVKITKVSGTRVVVEEITEENQQVIDPLDPEHKTTETQNGESPANNELRHKKPIEEVISHVAADEISQNSESDQQSDVVQSEDIEQKAVEQKEEIKTLETTSTSIEEQKNGVDTDKIPGHDEHHQTGAESIDFDIPK